MIIFKPNEDLPAALERAQRDVLAWCGVRGRDKEAKWAEWAGSDLQVMLRERNATIRFLQSPETGLRLAAVALVAEYWPANGVFAADTLRLAFEDPDPRIRGAALVALTPFGRYIADPSGFLPALLRQLFAAGVKEVLAEFRRGQGDKECAYARNDAEVVGECGWRARPTDAGEPRRSGVLPDSRGSKSPSWRTALSKTPLDAQQGFGTVLRTTVA